MDWNGFTLKLAARMGMKWHQQLRTMAPWQPQRHRPWHPEKAQLQKPLIIWHTRGKWSVDMNLLMIYLQVSGDLGCILVNNYESHQITRGETWLSNQTSKENDIWFCGYSLAALESSKPFLIPQHHHRHAQHADLPLSPHHHHHHHHHHNHDHQHHQNRTDNNHHQHLYNLLSKVGQINWTMCLQWHLSTATLGTGGASLEGPTSNCYLTLSLTVTTCQIAFTVDPARSVQVLLLGKLEFKTCLAEQHHAESAHRLVSCDLGLLGIPQRSSLGGHLAVLAAKYGRIPQWELNKMQMPNKISRAHLLRGAIELVNWKLTCV